MPMFSDMARTTVGAAPRNRPPTPSSFTILRWTANESVNHTVRRKAGPKARWCTAKLFTAYRMKASATPL